jgi:hypothetical protein
MWSTNKDQNKREKNFKLFLFLLEATDIDLSSTCDQRTRTKTNERKMSSSSYFCLRQLIRIYHQHMINKQRPKETREKRQALLIFAWGNRYGFIINIWSTNRDQNKREKNVKLFLFLLEATDTDLSSTYDQQTGTKTNKRKISSSSCFCLRQLI